MRTPDCSGWSNSRMSGLTMGSVLSSTWGKQMKITAQRNKYWCMLLRSLGAKQQQQANKENTNPMQAKAHHSKNKRGYLTVTEKHLKHLKFIPSVLWVSNFCPTLVFLAEGVWSKTHKRLKERFLIGWKRTIRANFQGSPLFQAMHNIKTEKQTIKSTYLVSDGCGRLAERKGHETDWWKPMPFSFSQPPTSNLCKISWFNCLFLCLYIVRSLKKRTSSKICMWCPVSAH